MLDPATAISTGKVLVPLLRRLARSDEATRLFQLLDEEFGARSGLSMAFWGQLQDDAAFMIPLAACLERGDGCDLKALARAITPYVAALDADGSPEKTATELAEAIERLAPKAKSDLRSGMEFGFERLGAQVARGHGPILLSWVPRQLTDQLVQLAESYPDLARSLGETLSEEASRATTAASLVREPPAWLDGAPARAWRLLSNICEAHGELEQAAAALEKAARAPGPRPARHLAHAAMISARHGGTGEAQRLLEQARDLDADDVAVGLAQADAERDVDERLRLLDKLAPTDPADRAHAACLAAEAHAYRHDISAALASAADATRDAPDSLRPLEIEAMARFLYAVDRLERTGPQQQHLSRAAELFSRLAADLESFGRAEDGAVLRARAAQCHLLLGERDAAERVLRDACADLVPRWGGRAAAEVASSLTDVGRADEAVELLKGVRTRDEEAELILAEARVGSSNGSRRRAGVEALERLMGSESPHVRQRAAFMRQSLATESRSRISVSERAHEIIAEADPALAALMWIDAAGVGERQAAERFLLPHSSDPRVLHRLADLNAADGDLARAIDLIGAATDRTARPGVHLRRAHLLILAGRADEALADLRSIQDNVEVVTAARVQALQLELEVQARRRAWREFERLVRRWLALEPGSAEANWHLVHVLGRLGRHAEARAQNDGRALQPDTL
jgi:tetratricopeptide (TPR) repeat protein